MDAESIASFLNTSPANILGLSGFESQYGTSNIAQNYGNYFGLSYPFPGTGPVYNSPNGLSYSTYLNVDEVSGFVNSGLSFALSDQGTKVNGADSPAAFVQALLAPTGPGAFNSTNPNYASVLADAINFVQRILNCL